MGWTSESPTQVDIEMLLKLVITTSLHSFGFLFSKLEGHGCELGTQSSIVLYMARLCESAKLEIGARTSLIC